MDDEKFVTAVHVGGAGITIVMGLDGAAVLHDCIMEHRAARKQIIGEMDDESYDALFYLMGKIRRLIPRNQR